LPEPKFQEISDGFMVTMFNGNGSKITGEVTGEAAYLTPALEAALIEMAIPDKPKSRLQKVSVNGIR
jgi:hypothetical protein